MWWIKSRIFTKHLKKEYKIEFTDLSDKRKYKDYRFIRKQLTFTLFWRIFKYRNQKGVTK